MLKFIPMPQQNHILFISSWYPNRNNPTHGIFNQAFAEAAALYNKVSVLHVCSDQHLSTDFEVVTSTEKDITTVTVYYKKIEGGISVLSQLKKRKQLIRGFETGYQQVLSQIGAPDLIQLNVVMPSGIGAFSLSKKYGIPYVVNEGWSGYCPDDGSYKGLALKYFTRKIIARAQLILPVSEDLKEAMLHHHLYGNYHIVPNVVNTALFVPENSKAHSNSKFIHISTLDDSQKNVSGILRAFKNAKEQQPDIELTLVGEGSNRQALEALVTQLGLQAQVTFTGRLMGKHLVNVLNAHDALVMFSNYETFCLTVAESLACGKPVITSRAGGLTNQLDSGLGMVIDKKDEAALTNCLLLFKSRREEFDTARMRQLIVDRYSTEKVGKLLTEMYNTVLLKSTIK